MLIRSVHFALVPVLLLIACGSEPSGAPKAPVESEAIAHETELVRLKLTPEAQKRLGITTEQVGNGSAADTRMTSGEIVIPAGAGGAPVTSASNLQQLAAQQVAADGELARARAQLTLARVAYDRASALVDEEAGSIRARDEATAALGAAKAAADAAAAQRRLLGPAVASLGNQRLRLGAGAGVRERSCRAATRPVSAGLAAWTGWCQAIGAARRRTAIG